MPQSSAHRFDAARIGVRPEHIDIAADGPWNGTVTHVERLGSDTFVYLEIDGGERLTVRLEGKTAVAQGEVVTVGPTGPVHRFDAGDWRWGRGTIHPYPSGVTGRADWL